MVVYVRIYNAQGQGRLPICWAASIATIVNYRKGTNITATDICDKMGLDYIGQNIDVKKDALSKYGLTYKKINSQLSWNVICDNIDNKYPIAASTFTNSGKGHGTVIHGYRFRNATKYIVMFNPGTKSAVTIQYKANGSIYTYNSEVWTWTKSLSFIG